MSAVFCSPTRPSSLAAATVARSSSLILLAYASLLELPHSAFAVQPLLGSVIRRSKGALSLLVPLPWDARYCVHRFQCRGWSH